jgi:predicted DNA binding CopG/RHH family protein
MAIKRPQLKDAIDETFTERGFDPKKKELLKQRIFRISDSDYNALKKHFDARGISISGGIRMIAKDYLNKTT